MVDIEQVMEVFTLVGIVIAGTIFARLAVKAPSIGSFRFQLSAFILVWVGAESIYEAGDLGIINVGGYETIGLTLHMISMALFALFIGMRSAQFIGAKPSFATDSTSKPARPSTGAFDKN